MKKGRRGKTREDSRPSAVRSPKRWAENTPQRQKKKVKKKKRVGRSEESLWECTNLGTGAGGGPKTKGNKGWWGANAENWGTFS